MTPKEKAEELFKKFLDATLAYDCGDHTAEGINNSILVMVREAKQCALIAVDEVMNNPYNHQMDLSEKLHDEFWEQVKEEIQKL